MHYTIPIHLLDFSMTNFFYFIDVKIMYALRGFIITSIGKVPIYHVSISYRLLVRGCTATVVVLFLFLFFLPSRRRQLIGPITNILGPMGALCKKVEAQM
jgi:hypothetical protein